MYSANSIIGTKINQKYLIVSQLGIGGGGAVYLAQDTELSRKVAIKILHHSSLCEDNSVKRFEREGRILSLLQHKNIVSIYSAGILDDAFPFMVMEFVEGRTLNHVLNEEGPLSAERVAGIALQVCAGLSAAHQKGVIHRDLKPQNLIIEELADLESVKILDFGLSTISLSNESDSQRLTQTGTLLGSVNYMSPELCAGQKVDARSDIYSLACVLYELLSGKPPFDADNAIGILHKHRELMPEPLPAFAKESVIGEELELVVFKALQKAPLDRFQSASEMADCLALLGKGSQSVNPIDRCALEKQSVPKNSRTPAFFLASIFALGLALALISYLNLKPAPNGSHEVLRSKKAQRRIQPKHKQSQLIALAKQHATLMTGPSNKDQLEEHLREIQALLPFLKQKQNRFVLYCLEADTLAALGRTEEQCKIDRKILEQCKLPNGTYTAEGATAFFRLGKVLETMGRVDESVINFERAIDIVEKYESDPDYPKLGVDDGFNMLAGATLKGDAEELISNIFEKKGDSKKTLDYLRRAIVSNEQCWGKSGSAHARVHLATLMISRGNRKQALLELEKFREELLKSEGGGIDPSPLNRTVKAFAHLTNWYILQNLKSEARITAKMGLEYAELNNLKSGPDYAKLKSLAASLAVYPGGE